jgi:hypothetical protein
MASGKRLPGMAATASAGSPSVPARSELARLRVAHRLLETHAMKMNTWFAIWIAALGCGKDDGAGSSSGKVAEVSGDDVAAVNAALPKELAGKLEFESGTIEHRKDKSFKLAIPKGWKKGFMPGELEPADADHFGSKTLGKSSFSVSSDCNGSCEKKDWAAVSDKVVFSQYAKSGATIVKDVKADNRRTMVVEEKASDSDRAVAARVLVAWWEPDATRYFTCRAELGAPLKGAVEAFEKACANIATP